MTPTDSLADEYLAVVCRIDSRLCLCKNQRADRCSDWLKVLSAGSL